MRNHTFILPFLAAALAVFTLIPGCDDIRYDLQETLNQVIEAERTGNGELMVRLLDPKNIEHYDRIAALARTADALQIRNMPPVDRFRIATIRATVSGAELAKLDGKGMVRLRTASRWNADERVPEIKVGRIRHRSPRATAELMVDGEPSGLHMEFVNLEGRWVLNDQAFDDLFNRIVADAARRIDRSEDYVVLGLASRATKKNFDNRIWVPPSK